MRGIKIDDVRPGQFFSLVARDRATSQNKAVIFMVINKGWFPSPSPNHQGTYYKGALVITIEGYVDVLDSFLMLCCEEVLALPAPCKH